MDMLWKWDPKSAVTLLHREHELLESQWQALQMAIDHSAEMSLIHEGIVAQLMLMRGHFRSEEQFMREVAYPEYEVHRAEHDMFIDAIGRFLVDLPASSPHWPQTVTCLHAWINQHNGEHDGDLGRFAARLVCS